MSELTKCKNCRSNSHWEEIGTVTAEKTGRTYSKKTLYQCGFCKRIIMIEGSIPVAADPLSVI
jgi:hypothetical protein